MSRLYQLTQDAAALYEQFQAEDGIDEQTLNDTLEAMMAPETLEECCKVARQIKADEEMYKSEIERLSIKKSAAAAAYERMMREMSRFLQAAGQKKMDCGVFTLRLTTGQPVTIEDERVIPREYYDPQPDKLSKTRIKAALKSGTEVPGASIGVSYGCTIK